MVLAAARNVLRTVLRFARTSGAEIKILPESLELSYPELGWDVACITSRELPAGVFSVVLRQELHGLSAKKPPAR